MRTATPPSTRLMWVRALTRRCPVCGQGHLFRHWFTMIERCPRCGLRFERTEGHWTGDLGINVIVSFGALLVALLGGFLVTYPDPPAVTLLIVCLTVAVVVPIAFFPFAKTIWLAIDLQVRPPESGEVAEEYRW